MRGRCLWHADLLVDFALNDSFSMELVRHGRRHSSNDFKITKAHNRWNRGSLLEIVNLSKLPSKNNKQRSSDTGYLSQFQGAQHLHQIMQSNTQQDIKIVSFYTNCSYRFFCGPVGVLPSLALEAMSCAVPCTFCNV